MDEGQAVDQDGDIIAVLVLCAGIGSHLVLIDDLQAVVVDVLFVNKGDVFGAAVISMEVLDRVGLDAAGLFHDAVVCVGDDLPEEPLPLAVGKAAVVQKLQLRPEVFHQGGLVVDGEVFITLGGQQPDELFFQLRLALVGVGTGGFRLVFGDNGAFGAGGDEVVGTHIITSYFIIATIEVASETNAVIQAKSPNI